MTESDGGSSFVRRWQLAAALKDLREKAGLTQGQAVVELRRLGGRWSESKLSRVENREHGIRPREVEQLLDVYSVRDAEARDQVLTLAAQARDRSGKSRFGIDVPATTRTLASIEEGAVAIRQFETMLVPGLLQTTDYTRAAIEAASPAAVGPIDIERRVAVRMTRQHVLRRANPPRFHAILDEGILRRPVGRPSVMRDQLRKLVDLSAEAHVVLQILPLFGGASPGLNGPFTLLTLPEPAPDVLYGEGAVAGMLFVEDRQRVRTCTLLFGMLTQLALAQTESVDMITEAARSYE